MRPPRRRNDRYLNILTLGGVEPCGGMTGKKPISRGTQPNPSSESAHLIGNRKPPRKPRRGARTGLAGTAFSTTRSRLEGFTNFLESPIARLGCGVFTTSPLRCTSSSFTVLATQAPSRTSWRRRSSTQTELVRTGSGVGRPSVGPEANSTTNLFLFCFFKARKEDRVFCCCLGSRF